MHERTVEEATPTHGEIISRHLLITNNVALLIDESRRATDNDIIWMTVEKILLPGKSTGMVEIVCISACNIIAFYQTQSFVQGFGHA